LYFAKASTAFKETGPFYDDTMKLISGWRAASFHPSATILTPDDLIGARSFSTSSFSLSNNVVLSFFELGGTYIIGAHSTRDWHILTKETMHH
jgi:hypothetical protein